MSRRGVHRTDGRNGGSRRRHLVLLLALGLFPIDTAMTTASPIEGRSPTHSVAQRCGMYPLLRFTQNPTSPNAGGVDRVAT